MTNRKQDYYSTLLDLPGLTAQWIAAWERAGVAGATYESDGEKIPDGDPVVIAIMCKVTDQFRDAAQRMPGLGQILAGTVNGYAIKPEGSQ